MTPAFDPVIHAQHRLQICALLSPVDDMEFAALRDELGVSDSVLSKHLSTLESAGYVELRKARLDARQRTWVALTRSGKRAFDGHVAELRRLVALSDVPAE